MNIGTWNNLKVERIKDFGIYLLDDEGNDVLLPKKQVPDNIKEKDEIQVFVYLDSKDRLIATLNTPYITIGEIKRLKVKSEASIGAFVDWGLEKDLLLPFKEQTTKVVEGKEYLFRMYKDKTSRLCVSMRLYEYLESTHEYKKGDSFTGIVYDFKAEMGAFVAVDDKFSGMIHKSELFNRLYVGDMVTGRVINVREDGKMDLALRKEAFKQMEDDSDMVIRIIESYNGKLPFNDKADKEIIKKEFGISKNAFKRACGKLLKEGKIVIGEDDIKIKEN